MSEMASAVGAATKSDFLDATAERLSAVTAYLDSLERALAAQAADSTVQKIDGPIENRVNKTVRYEYRLRPSRRRELSLFLIVPRQDPSRIIVEMSDGSSWSVAIDEALAAIQPWIKQNLQAR
jgi:hypothetical protein